MAAGNITTPGWLEEELCTSSYSIEWPATALAIVAGTAAAAVLAPITGSEALSSWAKRAIVRRNAAAESVIDPAAATPM